MQQAIDKAAALVEAQGYIRRFKGRTIVVKPAEMPKPKPRLERKPRPRPKGGDTERKPKIPAWIAGWKPEPQIAHWARGTFAEVAQA